MMMPMGPPFFWIFSLIGFVILLVFLLLVLPQIIRSLQGTSGGRNSGNEAAAERSEAVEIPEELRRKGREMMEEIEWEITLLEQQLRAEKDGKERKRIEAEIQEKRRQYRTIADRLGI